MCMDRVYDIDILRLILFFCRVRCLCACLLLFFSRFSGMVEQPPLQFYMRVMQNQEWDRIDVVTYADRPESLNPVVAFLQAQKAEGELMDNFHIHTVRRSE